MSSVVGLEQIKAAAVRIAGSVHKTDVCHDDEDINDEGDGDIDASEGDAKDVGDSSHVVVSVFLSTKKVLTCSTLVAMTIMINLLQDDDTDQCQFCIYKKRC